MSKKILVADDSITIHKVMGLTFADTDYEILKVYNGSDAVTKAREESPNLVLADVIMPGLDGYETCATIKNDPLTARIPVILLRDTFGAFDEERATTVGADAVIMKPFDADALLRLVSETMAKAEEEGKYLGAPLDSVKPDIRSRAAQPAVAPPPPPPPAPLPVFESEPESLMEDIEEPLAEPPVTESGTVPLEDAPATEAAATDEGTVDLGEGEPIADAPDYREEPPISPQLPIDDEPMPEPEEWVESAQETDGASAPPPFQAIPPERQDTETIATPPIAGDSQEDAVANFTPELATAALAVSEEDDEEPVAPIDEPESPVEETDPFADAPPPMDYAETAEPEPAAAADAWGEPIEEDIPEASAEFGEAPEEEVVEPVEEEESPPSAASMPHSVPVSETWDTSYGIRQQTAPSSAPIPPPPPPPMFSEEEAATPPPADFWDTEPAPTEIEEEFPAAAGIESTEHPALSTLRESSAPTIEDTLAHRLVDPPTSVMDDDELLPVPTEYPGDDAPDELYEDDAVPPVPFTATRTAPPRPSSPSPVEFGAEASDEQEGPIEALPAEPAFDRMFHGEEGEAASEEPVRGVYGEESGLGADSAWGAEESEAPEFESTSIPSPESDFSSAEGDAGAVELGEPDDDTPMETEVGMLADDSLYQYGPKHEFSEAAVGDLSAEPEVEPQGLPIEGGPSAHSERRSLEAEIPNFRLPPEDESQAEPEADAMIPGGSSGSDVPGTAAWAAPLPAPSSAEVDLEVAPTNPMPGEDEVGGWQAEPEAVVPPAPEEIEAERLIHGAGMPAYFEPAEAPRAAPTPAPVPAATGTDLPALVDAAVRKAVAQLSESVLERIAWEVVPELAEAIIRRELAQRLQLREEMESGD